MIFKGFPLSSVTGVDAGFPLRQPAVHFEDFVGGLNASTSADLAEWRASGTNAALANLTAESNCDCGELKIATAGAQNDEAFIQLNGSAFAWATDRKTVFQTRFKINSALTGIGVAMGMLVEDETDAYDRLVGNNSLGFAIGIAPTGVGTYYVSKAAGGATGASGSLGYTFAAATYYTVTMVADGFSSVKFYVDGTLYATYSGAQIATSTDYLSPLIGCEENNVGAAARSINVDYIYACTTAPTNGR